ncbi:MAG: hypothetical protein CL542_06770 [Alcanivorax sp.]|nr:MAG: hypothetical protein AXW13_12495 [Alcanivorax sp. Nap_24]MAD69687.1 hypothetical protein [Alcanivorax sp.]MAQ33729.1 hypothetical protein [Alcanivorax sp.]MBF48534.1 hypothetical protein [Alcanivorax sp.]MBT74474.1 hypothetical protein [Alcanivorax sp.]
MAFQGGLDVLVVQIGPWLGIKRAQSAEQRSSMVAQRHPYIRPYRKLIGDRRIAVGLLPGDVRARRRSELVYSAMADAVMPGQHVPAAQVVPFAADVQ